VIPQPKTGDARSQKLFELRTKMNQARKANSREANDERERANNPNSGKKKKRKTPAASSSENKDDALAPLLNQTAEDVSHRHQAKKQKQQNAKDSFGWNQFNNDAAFRSYEKQAKQLNHNANSDGYDADALAYGKHKPSAAAVDALAEDLKRQQEKSDKFTRRRRTRDDDNVDSINARNADFNKKATKSFDAYTKEIQANIERGTAL
jgi:hypothetical protein